MSDFREIISQGQKKIAFLVGAGAPVSIRVKEGKVDASGKPLIPGVEGLTDIVLAALNAKHSVQISGLKSELDANFNIESLLTRVRILSQVIGNATVYGYNAEQYKNFADEICAEVGKQVSKSLPEGPNGYERLVSWISGAERTQAVEIFTSNYDLLFEEAFENSQVAYYDGFTGAKQAFFDTASIASNNLPASWTRLWKIHGSLGWEIINGRVIRTANPAKQGTMIYPEHSKYDHFQKLPYAGLFDKLKEFLRTPDTLIITCGFSFNDAHISAVIDEGLNQNPNCSLFAFMYPKILGKESNITKLASKRSNLSVYGSDGAIINCCPGPWQLGKLQYDGWAEIRKSFWHRGEKGAEDYFKLGCFEAFTTFLMQARSIAVPLVDEVAKIAKGENAAAA